MSDTVVELQIVIFSNKFSFSDITIGKIKGLISILASISIDDITHDGFSLFSVKLNKISLQYSE